MKINENNCVSKGEFQKERSRMNTGKRAGWFIANQNMVQHSQKTGIDVGNPQFKRLMLTTLALAIVVGNQGCGDSDSVDLSRVDVPPTVESQDAVRPTVGTPAVKSSVVGGPSRPPSDSSQTKTHSEIAHQKTSSQDKKSELTPRTAEKVVIPPNPVPAHLRHRAPSLSGGTQWLNTAGKITLKDLRGKIVILDFWTYCCINCMHVLPDLKYLEKKYAKEIVVIGVHSAKFSNEKQSQNIRNAIMRYEIEHPVINDSKMTVWEKYKIRAWPSLAVIDPEGFYCGQLSGEGNRQQLETFIKKLIAHHKAKKTLDQTPVTFALERKKVKRKPLKYPGKIVADEKGNRLFIADSNHNRIVITTLGGQLLNVIGDGTAGWKDGTFAEAMFHRPQGMALVGQTLYVADTENHLIRRVNLKTKTVSTLAGTGKQAAWRAPAGKCRATALNSPWALQHLNGTLYICMAGPHQIWSHQIGGQTIQVYAGSGRENILDGPRLTCALAQPSGITTDGKVLYIADSEGSAIRELSLGTNGTVKTIIGRRGTLFSFGDVDGTAVKARLQHPLGIASHKNILYVADAYNHKIKKIELIQNKKTKNKTWTVSSWLGNGKAGNALTPPQLSEPEGVSVAAGNLYIADTNNHRICVANLTTGTMKQLKIIGLKPPQPSKVKTGQIWKQAEHFFAIPQQRIAPGKMVPLQVQVTLPLNHKINKQFPQTYQLMVRGKQTMIPVRHLQKTYAAQHDGAGKITLAIPLIEQATGEATLDVVLSFGYCRSGTSGLCKLKTVRWRIPLKISATTKAIKGVGKSARPIRLKLTIAPETTKRTTLP